MKLFTAEEINKYTGICRKQKYKEVTVTLGKRTFTYFVVPQALEPDLMNFTSRMTGKREDPTLFAVSDHMPEQFQPYAVAHEVIEFTEIGMETPICCVRALEEEWNLVPQPLRLDYGIMRHRFFGELIPYAIARLEAYTPMDIVHFQQTALRLDELVRQEMSRKR